MTVTLETLRHIARSVDRINALIGHAVAWLTLAMVVVMFMVVLLRYALGLGWIAMQETVTYMHATVFMAGAAYTLFRDDHVRVDIFYREMPARARAWVNVLGTLFLLLPVCVFILWSGWDYVTTAWGLQEGSREAGGLPGVYLLKTLVVVMPTLLILQGVGLICSSTLIILDAPPPGDRTT